MAKLEVGKFCPLIGKDCLGLECSWYTQIRGMNPQTGEPVDEWGCAVTWMPMLLIENSNQQRSTSAGVESFRNEMVKSNETNISVLSSAAQMLHQARNSTVIPAQIKEVDE
jgi:hypothetical protein